MAILARRVSKEAAQNHRISELGRNISVNPSPAHTFYTLRIRDREKATCQKPETLAVFLWFLALHPHPLPTPTDVLHSQTFHRPAPSLHSYCPLTFI